MLHFHETIALRHVYGVRISGVSAIKKTVNISTVRATPETKERLDRLVKELGFRSMAHFFTRSMETLFEQIAAGKELRWPLRFEEKKEEALARPPLKRGKQKMIR